MIEKMKFLSITGPKEDIDRVVNLYLSKYEIQIENALSELKTVKDLRPYIEINPYKELFTRAARLANSFNASETSRDKDTSAGRNKSIRILAGGDISIEEASETVQRVDKELADYRDSKGKLEEELDTRIFDRSQQPVCPTPVGILIIEQAQKILVQANRIKNIIEEEKHSLTGTFKLGILPTVAPYLLPRFFPQLMKKYPDLDIRVIEMKTNDIKKALQTGEIDAGIVASLAGMEELQQTPLFYEQFFVYVSRKDILFNSEVIRTSDLNGEQLWLLDEGHCFRDQLMRFCQMKSARASQLAYHLGSMETFMRMVESGKGVTFIPELAVLQLGDIQKELVRPFAIPCPTRQIVMLTNKNFIRHTLLEALTKEIKSSIPKEMLSLKATQAIV